MKGTVTLLQASPVVFIARYLEDVSALQVALESEGFKVDATPMQYTETEEALTGQAKCLLTHRRLWQRCAERSGYSIVAEADFVPVSGFGRLPLPFDPGLHPSAFAWLYAASPTLYRGDADSGIIGDSSGTVCYLLDSQGAKALLDLFDTELRHTLHVYTTWDGMIGPYLRRERGIPTFVPFRQAGEHGGLPNPEHKRFRRMPPHRADVLYGRLAFLPSYAQGSSILSAAVRARAKLKGLGRLVVGRTVRWNILKLPWGRTLLAYATRRLLSRH